MRTTSRSNSKASTTINNNWGVGEGGYVRHFEEVTPHPTFYPNPAPDDTSPLLLLLLLLLQILRSKSRIFFFFYYVRVPPAYLLTTRLFDERTLKVRLQALLHSLP